MSAPGRLLPLTFAFGLLASSAPASADPADIHSLRYDVPRDATIAASGAVFWFATELLKPSLAPADCRWCDRRADGSDSLNGLDSSARRRLKWSDTATPNAISDGLGMAGMPLFAVGLDALASYHDGGDLHRAGVDALIIAEASFIATALNQAVKYGVGRERPFVHELTPEQKAATSNPADNNLSFFSQHTTWSFALAASSGTVASMRGYRLAPLVWSVGMPLAAFTGYLRMAADKHYFTDVAVGALFGTAVGVGIPLLLHGRDGHEGGVTVTSASASPLGFSIAGTF